MGTPLIEKSFCTTREAAALLGVSVGTVQLWVESGLLQAWKTAGGHRRVLRDSVDSLLRKVPAPSIPAQAPAQSLTASALPAGAGPQGKSRRLTVLVVEDDIHLLRLYEVHLAKWPMAPEVIAVNSAVAGLVMMGRCNPDLLITDLHMPGMDGFEMIRVLARLPEAATTNIVVVTGLDAEDIQSRGGLPADVAVLPKPIPFDKLLNIAQATAELARYRWDATTAAAA